MPREQGLSFPERPLAFGTGLVALDLIINVDADFSPGFFAGGTCGNVLTILGYLGWQSSPISRLGQGAAGERVINDLKRWHLGTKLISADQDGSTPIIIQRIGRRSNGDPYHTFSWRCPACGAHLPGYKAVLANAAEELAKKLPAAQVFFFDRASRGALHLAKVLSDQGAVVCFEPSGVGDPSLFREAWALADIVKYSHERLRDIADLDWKRSEREGVLLEVETLGADGLRYRSRLPGTKNKGWLTLAGFDVKNVKDTAGCGDWCTAGLVDRLARRGRQGLTDAPPEKVRDALRFGQALAAWNCGFEGARGGMYKIDKQQFLGEIELILAGGDAQPTAVEKSTLSLNRAFAGLCPACKEDELAIQSNRRNRACT
jgi:sugar/nucleoside kinase (ribokinase family)